MKMLKYALVALTALSAVSCSKWTDEEKLTFDSQQGLKRSIPMIEMTSPDQLTPAQKEHYAKLRAWKQTPHVRGFGWFGGWTAKGTDPQKYLRMCDTIEKYNLDGFDIDYEPYYGGAGNLATRLTAVVQDGTTYYADYKKYPAADWVGAEADIIDASSERNIGMYTFVKTLYDRLQPKGRILLFDGEPYKLSAEASKMITFYVYQAYDESTTAAAQAKMRQGAHLDNWEGKTFLTLQFEDYSKTGGYPTYTSSRADIQKLDVGRQIMDYARMILPNGKRIAGIGTYHMELDTEGGSYRFLRQALNAGNRVSDTQKEEFQ